jgi:hypothetical protein
VKLIRAKLLLLLPLLALAELKAGVGGSCKLGTYSTVL